MTTLVFDGDCGFCTTCVRAMRRLRIRADVVVPWQQADLAALGLTAQQCQEAVQHVDDDGTVRSGHVAIAQLLKGSGPWKPLGSLLVVPGVSRLAGWVYAWVSAHRQSLPGGTPACQVPPTRQ